MSIDESREAAGSMESEFGQAPANLRAVVRVGSEFLLRSVDTMVSTQRGNLLGALVFSLVWMNNVRHITQSSANVEYGAPEELPPDALRHPVNVKTIAQQLGLPYETVRRHAQELIEAGDCIRVGKRGLIVPAAVLVQQERLKGFQESLPSLLRFLADLKRAGYDFAPYRRPHRGTVPLPPQGGLPGNARALLRLGMETIMRNIATMAQLHGGDYLMGLIYVAIWIANVHHITAGADNMRFGTVEEMPPDSVRRPVTVNAVAASLKLPYETTRRYINRMVETGLAVRVDNRGVIIPAARMIRSDHILAAIRAYHDVNTAIADLYRAGFDFSAY